MGAWDTFLNIVIVGSFILFVVLMLWKIFGNSPTEIALLSSIVAILFGLIFKIEDRLDKRVDRLKDGVKEGFKNVRKDIKEIKEVIKK